MTAASALAANTVARSLFGAGFPVCLVSGMIKFHLRLGCNLCLRPAFCQPDVCQTWPAMGIFTVGVCFISYGTDSIHFPQVRMCFHNIKHCQFTFISGSEQNCERNQSMRWPNNLPANPTNLSFHSHRQIDRCERLDVMKRRLGNHISYLMSKNIHRYSNFITCMLHGLVGGRVELQFCFKLFLFLVQ